MFVEYWKIITAAATAGFIGMHLLGALRNVRWPTTVWESIRGLRARSINTVGTIAIEAMPTVSKANANWLLKTKMFENYIGKWSALHSPITISRICIIDATPFGPTESAKTGFAYIKAYVSKPVYIKGKFTQMDSTEITFLRSNAVSVLLVASYMGKLYLILCAQLRIADPHAAEQQPRGSMHALYEKYATLETIAGMIDEGKNVQSVATNELRQETGIIINVANLLEVETLQPSIGGCNEEIAGFIVKEPIQLTDKQFAKLTKRKSVVGVADEGECIINQLIDINEWRRIKDMKLAALMAACYNHAIHTPGQFGVNWTSLLLKK